MTHFLTILLFALSQTPGSPPASLPEEEESGGTGNRLRATPNDVHGLIRDEFLPGQLFLVGRHPLGHGVMSDGPEPAKTGYIFTSREIETPFPFNDLVPSWNVDTDGGGFYVLLRVGRTSDDFWSPWYYLGSWGDAPQPAAKVMEDASGFINIDYFQSKGRFNRVQYAFHLRLNDGRTGPMIRRVCLACSNTLDDAELARKFRRRIDPGPKEKWARRLPVPFRSQKWEDEKIRGSICSPTSTSMVLEYRGVKHPTLDVCRRIWDPEYKLYGNWWRAVQGAYSFGVPGYLRRFGDWDAVKCLISHDQPIIASIKVKRGQLRSAPYRQSDGHLLVITGFTEDGDVCVNDPAAETAEKGRAVYARQDMENIWLANGGVGYILEPREPAADAHPCEP